jgi:hypothetical protein
MESYEFELYAFWEDLEYADDAYWDYGPSSGGKRKREMGKKVGITDKRQKREVETYDREEDPCLFVSREERTRSFFEPPPLLKNPVQYSFLADWRTRFANKDGLVENKAMPVDMKRAAEATTFETPLKVRAAGDTGMNMEEGKDQDEEEGDDWEDDEEDAEEGEDDEENGTSLDPDLLKEILKQKLGDVGLSGEDEAAFMQVISTMMSGDNPDDAAGDLTTTLLNKLTSDTGSDSALSGWLSRQGVALEGGEDDDDDSASVATVDLPEGLRHRGLNTRQSQDSPIDSVVGGEAQKRTSLLSGSPSTSSTKKRTATTMEEVDNPSKKQKKVTFDVPSSSSSDPPIQAASDLPTSEDPLVSERTLPKQASPVEGPTQTKKEAPAKRTTRKRKAADTDVIEQEKPPEKKKMRKKEVETPEAAASPMGPPAKRTRAAKAKAGK